MMGLRIINPMTVHDTFAHPSAFGYATLTLGRIFWRIWIFEIRGEFAQNLRIDSEYFHVRPRSPLDLSNQYVTNFYECLTMLANDCQCLTIAYESCQRLRTLYQRY